MPGKITPQGSAVRSNGRAAGAPLTVVLDGETMPGMEGAMLGFKIEDDRYTIHLGYIFATFVRPWPIPEFKAILGTNGMKRIRVTVEAGVGDGQLTISPAGSRGKKQ